MAEFYSDAAIPWYALQVRPNTERTTSTLLSQKGFPVMLPLYYYRSRWSDRMKKMTAPLFPGYSFCQFPVDLRMPVLTTPNVLRVVGFGHEPAPIPEHEVAWIRTIANSGVPSYPWEYLCAGCKVRVVSGPLEGVEGSLLRCEKHDRLIVSIEMLQRSVAVELGRDELIPVH